MERRSEGERKNVGRNEGAGKESDDPVPKDAFATAASARRIARLDQVIMLNIMEYAIVVALDLAEL